MAAEYTQSGTMYSVLRTSRGTDFAPSPLPPHHALLQHLRFLLFIGRRSELEVYYCIVIIGCIGPTPNAF